MDISIIEDEIANFCDTYFEEISVEVDEGIDYIEEYELFTPKENYTILLKFLKNLIQRFRVLDSNYVSPLLEKVAKDMISLEKMYLTLKDETQNLEEFFKTKVIKKSEILSELQKDILQQKVNSWASLELTNSYEQSKIIFKDLSTAYYEIFEEMFYEDNKYYQESLLLLLNSKTFYCEKLVWKEAYRSNFIKKYFQVKKISETLDTKHYLKHVTSLMRPYTPEYNYYQSCMRIFK